MPPFRIGYNIDCEHPGANRQAVVDAQIDLHSTYTLLLNDHKDNKWFFSKQIAERSPETRRIHRVYMDGRDGDLNEADDGNSPTGKLSAVNYLNFLQNLKAPKGTIHQVMCEPDMHGDRLKRKVDWLVSVIKEASKRGELLAVDSIQTVTIDIAELDAGLHDPLYQALDEHPEQIYSVHAYWLGDAWLNTTEIRMQSLSINQALDGKQYYERADKDLQADYIKQPDKAHLGREELIAARCRKIGVKVPRMVYTEIGVDNVRLVQQESVKAINGREPMGYPTMRHYWSVHYPQWSAAQAFGEMCKWLNRAMPDYIVGACLFGYDTAFEGGQYHLEDEPLQKWLSDYSKEVRTGAQHPSPIPAPPKPTAPIIVITPPQPAETPTTPPDSEAKDETEDTIIIPTIRDKFTPEKCKAIDAWIAAEPEGIFAQMCALAGWKAADLHR